MLPPPTVGSRRGVQLDLLLTAAVVNAIVSFGQRVTYGTFSIVKEA